MEVAGQARPVHLLVMHRRYACWGVAVLTSGVLTRGVLTSGVLTRSCIGALDTCDASRVSGTADKPAVSA